MNEKTTIEKAIERLEDLIKEAESHMTGNKIDGEIPIDDKTALEMAIQALDEMTIQALEKQVPKKVFMDMTGNGEIFDFVCSRCPNCSCTMSDEDKPKYCPGCGQALDWSEGNE